MWVSKVFIDRLLEDLVRERRNSESLATIANTKIAEERSLREQKIKDDIHLDWMRNRVNALEKQNAILMQKAAGIVLPVPEIVMSRGPAVSSDYQPLPSFEDVGDTEAQRLGLRHDDLGFLDFKEDHPSTASASGRTGTVSTQ